MVGSHRQAASFVSTPAQGEVHHRHGEREAAVLGLMTQLEPEPDHVLHVARLAVRIFDDLTSLHKLDRAERELLRFAALLHDIGWSVEGAGHHKHSQRLILEQLDGPFSDDEKRLIACVARYHRKATPRGKHAEYAALSSAGRLTCRKLAALLRIADCLDRSHRAFVRSVCCRVNPHAVAFHVDATLFPRPEIEALPRKAEMFLEVYGLDVRLVVDGELIPLSRPR